MTATQEHAALASQDGDIVQRLRALQRQRQAGEITAVEFDRAYLALNREVDSQCDRCGATPAPLRRGRSIYCGRCYGETA